MSVRDGYPSPTELIQNERRTLEFLKEDGQCHSHYPDLARRAGLVFDSTRSGPPGLDFHGEWEGSCRNCRDLGVFLGCLIRARTPTEYEEVSYCLAVRRGKQLLRKFHFDYDATAKDHPFLHLQYAGAKNRHLAASGVTDDGLHPWLSSPRLPFPPVSLALLLHLCFRELGDDWSEKFIARGPWRGLVRDNEDFMLRRFYDECSKHFGDKRKRRLLLTDAFYNG